MDTNGNLRVLLLKDISSRLPYGIKVQVFGYDEEKGEVAVPLKVYSINTDGYIFLEYNHYDVESVYIEDCLLYLRPMSSMTKEEKKEFCKIEGRLNFPCKHIKLTFSVDEFDWLNAHHFDYHGLIKKGLALEAPEDMYNIK